MLLLPLDAMIPVEYAVPVTVYLGVTVTVLVMVLCSVMVVVLQKLVSGYSFIKIGSTHGSIEEMEVVEYTDIGLEEVVSSNTVLYEIEDGDSYDAVRASFVRYTVETT